MKRRQLTLSALVVLAAGVVVLVIAVSGGSASKVKHVPTQTPVSAASRLGVRHTSLGNILVDAKGRTLYIFRADRPNHSTLSREGLAVWPAFNSTVKPQAEGGVNAAHVAISRQADGQSQVTYYGHPLYYYVGDKTAGQTKGQGLTEFGALWYVLSPTGGQITMAPSKAAPTSESTPSYSY